MNRLKLKVYTENECVMRKGDRGDWMGFISRGKCAVLNPVHMKEVLAVLQIGASFGERGLFGEPRTATVLALTWVNLQVLHFADWQEIADIYPAEMATLNEKINRKHSEHVRHTKVKDQANDQVKSKGSGRKRDSFLLPVTPRESGATAILSEAAAKDNEDSVSSSSSKRKLSATAIKATALLALSKSQRGSMGQSHVPQGRRSSVSRRLSATFGFSVRRSSKRRERRSTLKPIASPNMVDAASRTHVSRRRTYSI